ncbi:hypothetical protein [Terrihabitans rhizophilus]|uniref:ATP-grasp domain-containing protein n=1 Tax=Terrihabitans rhizophilus TaxID=3092662 RepID=A0ABU4RS94_9HYPH|nr:hypothetical protein [Terrihabitans sp. PJ23]MDX6807018.1 hypothetical protein [Terrihabitans sp. PJ23]
MIEAREPRLEVFVASDDDPSASMLKRASRRPALLFSPGTLLKSTPRSGRLYQGRFIPKQQQTSLMEAAGIPTPRSALLTPELRLGPEWGDFVITKPTARGTSSTGLGVQLYRRSELRYRAPSDFPLEHPGRRGPMLVQHFIDTGAFPSHYRVCSLLGRALYSVKFWSDVQRPDLQTATNEELAMARIATNLSGGGRNRQLVAEDDVLDLAKRTHDMLPDIPLMGIDIVREAATGKLFVLELNAGGQVWHLSSEAGIPFRLNLAAQRGAPPEQAEHVGRSMIEEQFGLFDIAAETLAAKTLAEAQ